MGCCSGNSFAKHLQQSNKQTYAYLQDLSLFNPKMDEQQKAQTLSTCNYIILIHLQNYFAFAIDYKNVQQSVKLFQNQLKLMLSGLAQQLNTSKDPRIKKYIKANHLQDGKSKQRKGQTSKDHRAELREPMINKDSMTKSINHTSSDNSKINKNSSNGQKDARPRETNTQNIYNRQSQQSNNYYRQSGNVDPEMRQKARKSYTILSNASKITERQKNIQMSLDVSAYSMPLSALQIQENTSQSSSYQVPFIQEQAQRTRLRKTEGHLQTILQQMIANSSSMKQDQIISKVKQLSLQVQRLSDQLSQNQTERNDLKDQLRQSEQQRIHLNDVNNALSQRVKQFQTKQQYYDKSDWISPPKSNQVK